MTCEEQKKLDIITNYTLNKHFVMNPMQHNIPEIKHNEIVQTTEGKYINIYCGCVVESLNKEVESLLIKFVDSIKDKIESYEHPFDFRNNTCIGSKKWEIWEISSEIKCNVYTNFDASYGSYLVERGNIMSSYERVYWIIAKLK